MSRAGPISCPRDLGRTSLEPRSDCFAAIYLGLPVPAVARHAQKDWPERTTNFSLEACSPETTMTMTAKTAALHAVLGYREARVLAPRICCKVG